MKYKRLIPLVCAMLLAGCGSSKEGTRTEAHRESGDDASRYEGDFRPADHDPDIHAFLGNERDTAIQQGPVQPGAVQAQPSNIVAGFRVQLISSADINEARAKQAEAESTFSNEQIYLIYDAPTYKIRAGNFVTRLDAERFLRLAVERGYEDAWIVPAKVFSNPPPPPLPGTPDQTNRK